MDNGSELKRQVNWKAFGCLGLGIVMIAGLVWWYSRDSSSGTSAQSSIPQTEQSQATNPVVAPPPTETEPVKQNPTPRGCYIGPKPNIFHKTAETRKDFADDNTKKLYAIADSGIPIIATAAGDDNEILMYSTTPENVGSLRKLIAAFRPNPSVRDAFCDEGFAEVQFVLRDENMNQTLVTKWQTDLVERVRHANQDFGASPM